MVIKFTSSYSTDHQGSTLQSLNYTYHQPITIMMLTSYRQIVRRKVTVPQLWTTQIQTPLQPVPITKRPHLTPLRLNLCLKNTLSWKKIQNLYAAPTIKSTNHGKYAYSRGVEIFGLFKGGVLSLTGQQIRRTASVQKLLLWLLQRQGTV